MVTPPDLFQAVCLLGSFNNANGQMHNTSLLTDHIAIVDPVFTKSQ